MAGEDVVVEDRLIGWAVPGLAVPWLIGYSAASGRLQEDFVAAAFIGTIFFVGSAITALGVARLEALRLSTGTDSWRDLRRQGLAKLLLSQILRFLQDQFFGICELHAPADQPALVGLCQSVAMEHVDTGTTYVKKV